MSFDWGAAAASAVGGDTSSGNSGGGFDWINALLAGAGGIAQGKIDRKALADQFKHQSQLLQMNLDARREEQERARGYELEDRSYRQGAIGNYAQFAPRTGLLANSGEDEAVGELSTGDQGANGITIGATDSQGGSWGARPEGWRNGDPGDGSARAHVIARQVDAGNRDVLGPGGGGLMSEAGYAEAGTGQQVSLGGGRPSSGGLMQSGSGDQQADPFNQQIDWSSATAIPDSARYDDGEGGFVETMRDAAGAVVRVVRDNAGNILRVIGAGYGGPLGAVAGQAIGDQISGRNNQDTDNGQGSSRRRGNPISSFINWIRNVISND